MKEEERKAWKEVVGTAEYTSKYNLTFDTTTFEGAKLLREIAQAKAILAADAVIRRAGDVEGLAKALCADDKFAWFAIDPDSRQNYMDYAAAVSAWLLKGG